jgi:hypothetical protein
MYSKKDIRKRTGLFLEIISSVEWMLAIYILIGIVVSFLLPPEIIKILLPSICGSQIIILIIAREIRKKLLTKKEIKREEEEEQYYIDRGR